MSEIVHQPFYNHDHSSLDLPLSPSTKKDDPLHQKAYCLEAAKSGVDKVDSSSSRQGEKAPHYIDEGNERQSPHRDVHLDKCHITEKFT